MIRIAIAALLGGAATLGACNSPPAHQTPADYYRAHPDVPNPRGGSFKKSEPGKYEYVTPTDAATGVANSAARSTP